MTRKHEALMLADEPSDYTSFNIEETQRAQSILRQQHALIVQMAHVFEGEHFEHDDQRKAIADCTQYLKAKP